MQLASILDRAVALWPERVALIEGERRWTYAQCGRRAAALAAGLRSRGLAAGERVAALLPNGRAFFDAYHAAARAGLVLVPINTRLADREVAGILEHAGVRHVLRDPALEPLLARAPAGLSRGTVEDALDGDGDGAEPEGSAGGGAVAQLYYTSGTTGRPKGVILTHDNVGTHALGAVAELGLDDGDTWAHVAPMFHLADAWATFAVTWVGGVHVMVPRFDPAAVLATFERERVTVTNLVPTMLNALVHDPAVDAADLSSFRLILSGGAPIAPELVRRVMAAFGGEYVQTYGMTETSPYLTLSTLKRHLRSLPEDEQFRYRARTGTPFVTVQLRVVGEDGRDVPADDRTVGEIRVRGDSVTPGYWQDPGATAAAFEDGWLRTGDLAVVEPEGYVQIVDRLKDVIISGGENVYSTEVENALYEHPDVVEAAVFGVPDERWGEAVAAAVVRAPGADLDAAALQAFCQQRLARYKAPRRVWFLDELPKTGSGKITKAALRERYR